jgi:putative heme-binding domain-containing protein
MKRALAVIVFSVTVSLSAQTPLTDVQRNTIAFESLSRLRNVDIDSNPNLKAAIYRLLDQVRGTDQFLDIVKQYHLSDCDPGLVELAIKNPTSETGVEATRLVLAHKNSDLFRKKLEAVDAKAACAAAEALGNAAEQKTIPVLLPIALDQTRNMTLRKTCVRALARTSEGAIALLDLAKKGTLAEDLKFTAGTELRAAHWTNIQTEAVRLLPLPTARDSRPLPATAELLKMASNPSSGEKVFFRQQPGCSICHTIRGKGGQIGPDLSEIGTKLAKEAIVEAILEPSAGISVGYETYSVDLKSGDEAYGLLVSDSNDDIAIKDSKGIVTHYKKSEIANKRKLKVSLMPTGLQQGMSTQEFADLIAFLGSLKKQ